MAASQAQIENDVPHARYHAVNRKSYGTQQEVAEAWADGAYPTHNTDIDGAHLYTGSPGGGRLGSSVDGPRTNFHGVQHRDGTGVLWHYNTREAIRTANGLIIRNHECWSAGFAHCSPPRDSDTTLPLSAIEHHLDDGDTVFDISEVLGSPGRENQIAVIGEGADAYGVAVGHDASSTGRERHFTVRLTTGEFPAEDNTAAVSKAITTALTPPEVDESDLLVVPSTAYARTYLSEEDLEAHVDAGGHTCKSESRWRDLHLNRQQFRADLQGKVIVRQGEWFFIPTDKSLDTSNPSAGGQLGNHRAMRYKGAVVDLQECACGASSWECGSGVSDPWVCKSCGSDAPLYVRGQISHVDGDHNSINLGETWHLAVTHDRDVWMYDDHPATGGGGGWD